MYIYIYIYIYCVLEVQYIENELKHMNHMLNKNYNLAKMICITFRYWKVRACVVNWFDIVAAGALARVINNQLSMFHKSSTTIDHSQWKGMLLPSEVHLNIWDIFVSIDDIKFIYIYVFQKHYAHRTSNYLF